MSISAGLEAILLTATNTPEVNQAVPLWEAILTLLGSLFILAGALFTAAAALGLFRFKDLFARMHAATKPQMLGLLLICVGITLTWRTWHWALVCTVVVAIQLLAAPIGSHMLGRTAYRTKVGQMSALVADELGQDTKEKNSNEDSLRG